MSEPEQKPIIEKVKDYIPDTNDVKEAFSSATTAVSNGIENVKSGVQNTLGEFSEKGVVNASNEFLESNGLFAKFAFIVLVLIIFLFLFKMGISIISYFSQASNSPYVIKGLLEGSSSAQITQNPASKNSVPILRSVNQQNGVEFTWSIWLFLQYNKPTDVNNRFDTIFVKAPANNFDVVYGVNNVNGPGLYVVKAIASNPIKKIEAGTVGLMFLMDDIINNNLLKYIENNMGINIPNIPLNKWVHVAFRLENTVLDAYVNGIITDRTHLLNAPKQNFYDVFVAPNGGFQGQLSNLQYFNRALNVFEINNIVMFGPNLTNSKYSNNAKNATGNYSYLNTSWYSGWYNNG
jgi:hypothetical protein